MAEKSNILHNKLQEFIRKYHLYECYRGILFVVLFTGVSVLLASVSEIALYYSPATKGIFVFSFSILLFSLSIWLIIKPLTHYFGFIDSLSKRKASVIISTHFPEIKDHLINALELIDQSELETDNSLLLASIHQKTEELRPVPFTLAIDVSRVKRIGVYALSLIIFTIAIYFLWPDFTNSTSRLINYSVAYEAPAPFTFVVQNDLHTQQGSDYLLTVKVEGEVIPQSVFVNTSFGSFFLEQVAKDEFHYQFVSVTKSFTFQLASGKYHSKEYHLSVLPSPRISDLKISVKPPQYTKVEKFVAANNTNVTIPEGSSVNWQIESGSTDSIVLLINDTSQIFTNTNGRFSLEKNVVTSFSYSLVLCNEYFSDSSMTNFNMIVEKDQFPKISIIERKDTTGLLQSYFKGVISDDYGFTQLLFTVKNLTTDSSFTEKLSIDKTKMNDQFFYFFDFSKFSQGDAFQYYFTIFDNDRVNGAKYTRSSELYYTLPTEEALAEFENEVNTELMDKIDQSISKASEIQKDITDLKNKLLNENVSEWQRNQMLESIQQKHEDLKKLVEQVNDKNIEKNRLFENVSEKEDLKAKQKELQDLLSQVMDKELEDLMKELDRLKSEFDRNKLFDLSEELEMSYEDMEKQLDKDIELLKRYDLERKLDNTIEDLSSLAKEQKDLAEDIKDGNKEENSKSIEEQKEKLSDLEEEYKSLLEQNNDLENKLDLNEFQEDFDGIKKELSNSSQQSQDGKKGKSGQSMENAGEQSESLAQKMQEMMMQNSQDQKMENIDDLRQILDNLIIFSFDQEIIIDESKALQYKDPRIPEYANRQHKLKENFTVIEDSLYALAKREPMIGAQINSEVLEIQKNLRSAISYLENNRKSNALRNQRYVMTSTNNLALLLSEILKQMQQQMAQQMQGQQQCQNPGSGKGGTSLGQMKSQQQSLKQQLQQMIDQMKSEKEGGKSPGGKSSMSKKLSQMLTEQEKYNQQLQEMLEEGSFSPDAVKKLNEIKKMMDQTERDIINRNISPSTMFRQDQIMTRLLEAEKAEREREQDNKRKSKSGDQNKKSTPPEEYFSDEMKQNNFNDVIERSSLELHKKYKRIYEEYLIQLSSDN